jgi:VIT1/CCC1 family predicted Fe2+/Mn2+ transporter
MRDLAYRDWSNNPFHLKAEREMERGLLEHLRAQGIEPEQMILGDDAGLAPKLPGGPWDYPSAQRNRKERYALTVLGSLIIIIPIVIMTFVPGQIASIATVVSCTMFFAVATAYFSPTKPPLELMIATAAYAAVLVVFVGASITGVA